jgi:hypothetical protein
MKEEFIMKIDSALKVFSEKYDRMAIESIENISKDFGLNIQKFTIKAFNINEGFADIEDFLTKYAKYKIENMNNSNSTPQTMICERVENNIKEELFKETQILYSDIPSFIESYISGISKLIKTADSVKKLMFESGVDSSSIGDINQFVDIFVGTLHESFDPTMDRFLWASGYNSNKALSNLGSKNKTAKAVFL